MRANAAIGRALRLILLNCLKYRPGVSDRATMGTPGKYTCCIAENEETHPWEPWHVERGFQPQQSTVTLVAACTMIQVWNYGNHEQLLRAIGDAISYLGSIAILATFRRKNQEPLPSRFRDAASRVWCKSVPGFER